MRGRDWIVLDGKVVREGVLGKSGDVLLKLWIGKSVLDWAIGLAV